MMFSVRSLSDDDRRVLDEIDAMRRELSHQTRMPPKWLKSLRKFLAADAVAASNYIEGFRVRTADVADLMDGELDVDVSDEDRDETLAYVRMMSYVYSLSDAKDFSHSLGLLNALHWMLQGHRHCPRKLAGQWRTDPVYVTDTRNPGRAVYTGPEPEQVPAL